MNLEQHVYEIETLGYTTVKNIISELEIATLKEELKAALEEDQKKYGNLPGKRPNLIVEMVSYGSAFVKLLENKKMHQFFSHFLGDTCILYSYTSTILKPNNEGAVGMHVDTHRLIPGYHTGMIMTLALDEFTIENGASLYLPGSHLCERTPSEEEFYKNAQPTPRQAGDAVIFNPRVFHSPGFNSTDKIRYGLAIYACRSFMKPRFDFPRLASPEVLTEVGEKGRAFLGFNVRVPTCSKEFYVPAEERLYLASQG